MFACLSTRLLNSTCHHGSTDSFVTFFRKCCYRVDSDTVFVRKCQTHTPTGWFSLYAIQNDCVGPEYFSCCILDPGMPFIVFCITFIESSHLNTAKFFHVFRSFNFLQEMSRLIFHATRCSVKSYNWVFPFENTIQEVFTVYTFIGDVDFIWIR